MKKILLIFLLLPNILLSSVPAAFVGFLQNDINIINAIELNESAPHIEQEEELTKQESPSLWKKLPLRAKFAFVGLLGGSTLIICEEKKMFPQFTEKIGVSLIASAIRLEFNCLWDLYASPRFKKKKWSIPATTMFGAAMGTLLLVNDNDD